MGTLGVEATCIIICNVCLFYLQVHVLNTFPTIISFSLVYNYSREKQFLLVILFKEKTKMIGLTRVCIDFWIQNSRLFPIFFQNNNFFFQTQKKP